MRLTVVSAAAAALPLFTSCDAQMPTADCPTGKYYLVDASQRPDTRNCGTFGSLDEPSPLGAPRRAASMDVCVQICKSTNGCVSLGYAKNAGSCVLYKKRLIDMGYRDRNVKKGAVFSNQLCYRCVPLACPNQEAVQNGGFEQQAPGDDAGKAAFWVNDGLGRSDQDGVQSGHWTMGTGDDSSSGAVNQTLQCVNTGFEYDFSAFYTALGGCSIDVFLDGVNIVHSNCNVEGGADGFKHATATVKPNSTTPVLRIELAAGISSEAEVDNVSLKLRTP